MFAENPTLDGVDMAARYAPFLAGTIWGIRRNNIITSGNISPNPPRSRSINDNNNIPIVYIWDIDNFAD